MDIAAKIKDARRRKGLSQEALALLTDMTQGRISGYETGKIKPEPATIRALETVLGPLRDHDEALAELVTLTPEEAEAAREVTERHMRVELARLDQLHETLWDLAMSGDEDALPAVDRLLKTMDARIDLIAHLEAVPASPSYEDRLQSEQDLMQWHRDVISGRATYTRVFASGKRLRVAYGENARGHSAHRLEVLLNAAAERQRDYIQRGEVQRVLAELAMLVRDRLRSLATRGVVPKEAVQQILDELADESLRRWTALVE